MEWDDPQLETPEGRKKGKEWKRRGKEGGKERCGNGRMGEKAEPAVNGIKVQKKRIEWSGGDQDFN